MSLKPKGKAYYAVKYGFVPGIYPTWDEAKAQISGFTGAIFKKFATIDLAKEFMDSRNYKETTKKKKELTINENLIVKHKYNNLDITQFYLDGDLDKNKMYQFHPDNWTQHQNTFYLFTDGSYQAKINKSGYGIYLGEKCLNISTLMPDGTTNNKCELLAIQVCLIIILHYKSIINEHNIKIISDSKYSIQSITEWIPNWKKNNWITKSGTPVKNPELMQELDKLYTECINIGLNIEFKHQNSHTTLDIEKSTKLDRILWEGNYLADVLAKNCS